MIDSQSEGLQSLGQAADSLPRRREGRKTHVSTLFRWSTVGCRGVVLETLQVGGTRCTSREALQRFFERLSAPPGSRVEVAPGVGLRSAVRRLRDSERAAAELKSRGA